MLWKVHALQERTTTEEHAELVSLLADLRREFVVHDLEEIGFEAVMAITKETGLTFYDASYLACAEQFETPLVSEDAELRDVASERTETCRVQEFQ